MNWRHPHRQYSKCRSIPYISLIPHGSFTFGLPTHASVPCKICWGRGGKYILYIFMKISNEKTTMKMKSMITVFSQSSFTGMLWWRGKVWSLYFLSRYKHESQPEGSHLYNIPPSTTSAQNMDFLVLINQYPNKIWGLGNWYIHFPAKYLCFQLDAKQVWLVLNEYFHQQVLWIDQPISS